MCVYIYIIYNTSYTYQLFLHWAMKLRYMAPWPPRSSLKPGSWKGCPHPKKHAAYDIQDLTILKPGCIMKYNESKDQKTQFYHEDIVI